MLSRQISLSIHSQIAYLTLLGCFQKDGKRILVFPLVGNYLNSIISVLLSIRMPKEHHLLIPRLASTHEEGPRSNGEGRLDSIIKTFRENNLRLMQKIEECDRMRHI